MARFTPAFLLVLARFASVVSAQECTGNTAMCPNSQDGVSSNYLQCNSWSQQYESVSCGSNLVCYANPSAQDTIICGPPGSGGVPDAGACTDNMAKCVSSGQSGAYLTCESWSGQYVNSMCPENLTCYDNADNTGVICQ
ncbi:hypothetical protein GQ54DRAFT_295885 [Martensiomyces pterosporus]|nr:hypothetical protein GQ54DRAFT_295885 [Martensiomyces pterosporus]